MSVNYSLIYCENTDNGNPVNSTKVRFFCKKKNAQKAMSDAFDKTDAIMHYSEMETDDEHYIDRSEDSITVHCGMDSMRWEIIESVPEDASKNEADIRVGDIATLTANRNIIVVDNGTGKRMMSASSEAIRDSMFADAYVEYITCSKFSMVLWLSHDEITRVTAGSPTSHA